MAYNPTEAFNRSFFVWLGMTGDGLGDPGYRELSFGGISPNFTWEAYIEGSVPGYVHTCTVKNWYKWGARKFILHTPFGRPTSGPEAFGYQADQYLIAKHGMEHDGETYYRCPWISKNFVKVWKSLITGSNCGLSDEIWDSWTSDWFNPDEPIEVHCILGTLVLETGTRFNDYFEKNEELALQRLKDSFSPIIESGMKVGADAFSAMTGPKFEEYKTYSQLVHINRKAQKYWWKFVQWVIRQVGLKNMYTEAYPWKKFTDPSIPPIILSENPYKNFNVFSEEYIYDHDYGYIRYLHSELGKINIHTAWGNWRPFTRYADGSPGKYYFLIDYEDSQYPPTDALWPNRYYVSSNSINNLYGSMCDYGAFAYVINEQPMQLHDPNTQNIRLNISINAPQCFIQDYSSFPGYTESFKYKFANKQAFIDYLQWTKDNQDYNPTHYPV